MVLKRSETIHLGLGTGSFKIFTGSYIYTDNEGYVQFYPTREAAEQVVQRLIASGVINPQKYEIIGSEHDSEHRNRRLERLTMKRQLKDVITSHKVGCTITRLIDPSFPEQVEAKCLKINDLKSLEINLDNVEDSFWIKGSSLKNQLEPGDLLLPKSFINTFYVAIVPQQLSCPLFATNNILVVKPNVQVISPVFLGLWLRSDTVLCLLTERSKEYSRGMNVVNRDALLEIPVPVLPLAQQETIVEQYREIVHLQSRAQLAQIRLQDTLNML